MTDIETKNWNGEWVTIEWDCPRCNGTGIKKNGLKFRSFLGIQISYYSDNAKCECCNNGRVTERARRYTIQNK
jgi:hypothetical protein